MCKTKFRAEQTAMLMIAAVANRAEESTREVTKACFPIQSIRKIAGISRLTDVFLEELIANCDSIGWLCFVYEEKVFIQRQDKINAPKLSLSRVQDHLEKVIDSEKEDGSYDRSELMRFIEKHIYRHPRTAVVRAVSSSD